MSDRKRFAACMDELFGAFSRELTEPAVRGYWRGLAGMSIEAIERGVDLACVKCKTLPTAAEIRELVGSGGKVAIEAAWEEVRRQIVVVHRGYPTARPRPEDDPPPQVDAAVRAMGGWARLSEMSSDDFNTWARKHFFEVYPTVEAREEFTRLADVKGLERIGRPGEIVNVDQNGRPVR